MFYLHGALMYMVFESYIKFLANTDKPWQR